MSVLTALVPQPSTAAQALRRAIQLGLPSRLLPAAWIHLGLSLQAAADPRGARAAWSQLDQIVVQVYAVRRTREAWARLRDHAVERTARAAVKMLSREQLKSRSPPPALPEAVPPKNVATVLMEIEEFVAEEARLPTTPCPPIP